MTDKKKLQTVKLVTTVRPKPGQDLKILTYAPPRPPTETKTQTPPPPPKKK